MLTYIWAQGNTHTQLQISLVDANNNAISLVGVLTTDITLKKRQVVGNVKGQFVTLSGTVTAITNAAGGVFTYQFAPSDVSTPGYFDLVLSINYGTNDTLVPLPVRLNIQET